MNVRRVHSFASVAVLAVAVGSLILLIALPKRTALNDIAVPNASGLDPIALSSVLTVVAPPSSKKHVRLETMVEEIVALGPKALPIAIALVCGVEPLPEHAFDSADGAVHPRALELRDLALRTAIATYPPRVRLRHMAERAQASSADVKRVLFRMIGEIEHIEAAATLLEVAEGVEPIQWRGDYLSRPFEDAMSRRLAAHPQAVWDLRGRSRALESGVCAAMMRAAARVPTTLTVGFVVDSLGRDDELDLGILTALAKLPKRERLALPESVSDRVRTYLTAMDARTRRAAIDACGSLGDMFGVDTLIGMLEDDDPLVGQAAHRALCAIVGSDLGRTPAGWERWFDEENQWRERHWTRLVRDLHSEDVGLATAAMRELAAHPLFRDEATIEIALAMPDSGLLVRSALEALAASASPLAIPLLIDALSTEDQADAQRALDALRSLTGLDFGLEPELWRTVALGQG